MFGSEAELEEALSRPHEAVIEMFRTLPGDVMLLGAGGKMGLSLARMARRAADAAGSKRRIIAVSRFQSLNSTELFHEAGIETITCDLLNEAMVNQLPDAVNVIVMAGMKFGATGSEWLTWAMNAGLPFHVCRHFRRSRLTVFSTGNVYGLTPMTEGGSREADELHPTGEYAMSCLGRERMYEYHSRTSQIPVSLIRLNYACDLRYGVLVDLAQKVLHNQTIDLSMSYFNTIWQGDANAWSLLMLERGSVPPTVINITGPELLSVKEVCEELGRLLYRQVTFCGKESETSLISNTEIARRIMPAPVMTASELIAGVAHWIQNGGRLLSKPTHFESRDGKF
ncbi:MAG: NAD-dependent epimerase/dehydratase family protein [Planctomycetaceae bacterium]